MKTQPASNLPVVSPRPVRTEPSDSSPVTALHSLFRDCLQNYEEGPGRKPARGRPPVVPAVALWGGLLTCILLGFHQQLDLWRLLTLAGLWTYPRFNVGSQAIYNRLQLGSPEAIERLFKLLTEAILQRFPAPPCSSIASFATNIVALDKTVLDPVLRRTKVVKGAPELPAPHSATAAPGATAAAEKTITSKRSRRKTAGWARTATARLKQASQAGEPTKDSKAILPGALSCLFDIRRQQWLRVKFTRHPEQNEHVDAAEMIEGLPVGTLILADLGYFGFAWFDLLAESGYHYVSRMKEKVSSKVLHTLYQGGSGQVHLLDQIVYLGAYRADRAAHAVRLIQVTVSRGANRCTYRYITNVLSPHLLSAADAIDLYRRRWDIERAFNLLKTDLHLHLLFSGHENVLLQQVYATLVIAQALLAMRSEIARRLGADPREVSLALMVRWFPVYASLGRNPIDEFVVDGRRGGFVRPYRSREFELPQVAVEDYDIPTANPPPRTPRYAPPKSDRPRKTQTMIDPINHQRGRRSIPQY
ncbi:MAG: IS4 family transposase [Candidatus Dormibacteraceae bacterium]